MLTQPSTFGRHLRRHTLNAMLAATSIACAYLICEFLFFRFYLPYASLNIRTHLPDTAGVLVQNSKSEFVPRNYIAILGNSIAEGVGDWLLQANGDRSKPFHSADVIRSDHRPRRRELRPCWGWQRAGACQSAGHDLGWG